MSKIPFLLLLLFSSTPIAKHKTIVPLPSTEALNKKNDTVFLLREKDSVHYHAVFVEKDRQSQVYKNVLNFKMDNYDAEAYLRNYHAVKRRSAKPFRKYNLAGLPTEWLPLYSYRGSFYIYQPSEPGNTARITITDSTMVHWYMDGPTPQLLQEVIKLNNHTWQLKFRGYLQRAPDVKIIIHIIDPINKIAVWEDVNAPIRYRYSLYVPRENAAKFDLVVNYCLENKVAEFNFDSIDYVALLKGH
ncbi:hypothetical protein [Mucilaginibacter sp. FT3.2]|uniref:hypothetical protein n=1 Tax=Mucilaginibacter sp. FT3.2 TaxID=2723090 RepID=UPI0016169BED|nr:hypothetical protein [Mucilaginibacter sp. FT3.2]MBB6233070.1 hypothetical protein [Mucilaginibacter sp. FT3.2]